MLKHLSNLLLISGALLVLTSIYFIYQRNNPNRLSFDTIIQTQKFQDSKDIHPTALKIPELNIHSPVINTVYDGITWKTTPDGISYLINTPTPGETGNSILYGHNWASILGNLHKAKPGQIITIYFSNGTNKQFKIETTQIVKPTTLNILDQTKETKITLYTCIGLFDQDRFVATAIPL